MTRICTPGFSGAGNDQGWSCRVWASADVFGQPVPLRVTRWRLDAGSRAGGIALGGSEAMAYVIAGAGTAVAAPPVDGERFPLARESVLWLAGCPILTLRAGSQSLDVLVAESAVSEVAPAPLRKVLAVGKLPRLVSTRDTRDRLDLVTDDVPVGARLIRADRIIYHPGDTAAAHYHTDCHHVFCVLAGSGLLYSGDAAHRLNAGDSALVGPGEVHWFENDRAEEFSFVEFWAPPPTGTVWTVAGDRCSWAPAR
jgi:mannose-6-phosphate isomerase-like protein (cupin superfamily)